MESTLKVKQLIPGAYIVNAFESIQSSTWLMYGNFVLKIINDF